MGQYRTATLGSLFRGAMFSIGVLHVNVSNVFLAARTRELKPCLRAHGEILTIIAPVPALFPRAPHALAFE